MHIPFISILSDTPQLTKWLAAPLIQLMTPELIRKSQKLEMWSGHILYFITVGGFQLEVVDEEDLVEKKAVFYFRGDTFGFEFAPTAPQSRVSAGSVCNKYMRVVALEDTQVFGINRHAIATILKKFPFSADLLKQRISESLQKTADRQFTRGDLDWRDVVARWSPDESGSLRLGNAAGRRKFDNPPALPPMPSNPLAHLPPFRNRPVSAASSVETKELHPFVIEDL